LWNPGDAPTLLNVIVSPTAAFVTFVFDDGSLNELPGLPADVCPTLIVWFADQAVIGTASAAAMPMGASLIIKLERIVSSVLRFFACCGFPAAYADPR
jgi:hypothetical protein